MCSQLRSIRLAGEADWRTYRKRAAAACCCIKLSAILERVAEESLHADPNRPTMHPCILNAAMHPAVKSIVP